MSFYNVNTDKLITLLTPVDIRKNKRFRWLRALTAPCRELLAAFLASREANLYYLRHNGQVCKLRGALNDLFDPVLRRIVIEDTYYPEYVYVYRRDELKPVYAHKRAENKPVYVNTRDEVTTADLQNVFIILVPHDVVVGPGYSDARARALVERYRLAGMSTYEIT